MRCKKEQAPMKPRFVRPAEQPLKIADTVLHCSPKQGPTMTNQLPNDSDTSHPPLESLQAAQAHVQDLLKQHPHALPAAEGLLEGLVMMTGTLLGDPGLPQQLVAGYQGVLDVCRPLLDDIKGQKSNQT